MDRASEPNARIGVAARLVALTAATPLLVAAAAAVFDPAHLVEAINRHGVLRGPAAGWILAVLPPLELLLAGLLLGERLRAEVKWMTAALYAAFAGYHAAVLSGGGAADCGCFGEFASVPIGVGSVAALSLMAVTVAAVPADGPEPRPRIECRAA